MSITKYILLLTVLILTILVTSSKAEVTTNVTEDVDVQTNITTQSDTPGTGDVTTITETITTTTTTTDTTTTTTTTTPGTTEQITDSNEYHTLDICSQSNVDCTGLIQNNTGLGVGGGWGIEMGYSGGTVTINKNLNDYFTTDELNAGFSGNLSADILFNCGNQVGGSCSSGREDKVTLRQTYTDNNGNVITQSADIYGYYNNFYTHSLNNVIVNSNNASNWTGQVQIYGQDLGFWGPTGSEYYGPHVDNIDWDITTNGVTTTSSSTTTDVDIDVTTTYETTVQYCFELGTCPDDNTTATDIANATITDDGKTYDEFIDDKLKDIKVEDLTLVNTTVIIEDDLGNIEEVNLDEYVETKFVSFIETNGLTETFETALVEEGLGKEEFFETMTDSIKEEFGEEFNMGGDNFKEDLTTEGGPSDLTENTVEEETVETENNITDLKESNDTTTETKVEEESNETISESKDSENVSNESDVDKNTETERTEKTENNEGTVDAKTDTDVKTNSGSSIDTRSIEKKVERVIAKVLAKLKKVDQKLQAVQYITTQGIKSGEADISGYINKRIYGNQNLYSNVPFYENLNILEQQQIYKDVSLNTYASNDPIAVKQRLTVEIESEISRIQAELYALKQKRGS